MVKEERLFEAESLLKAKTEELVRVKRENTKLQLGVLHLDMKTAIEGEISTIRGTYETVIYRQKAMLEDLELKRSNQVQRLQNELARAKSTKMAQAQHETTKRSYAVANKVIEAMDEDRKRIGTVL